MKLRKPNRLKNYDYSLAGWYYVTICTQDHISHFGTIVNEKMVLNEIGKIADEYWNDIPLHYPTVSLDEYIIMPNHIHGIIIIDCVEDEHFRPKNVNNKNILSNNSRNENITRNESIRSLRKTNLSNVIKGIKIGVTKWCRTNNHNNFKWQRSYYDRIIRNEKELYNIRKYIQQNSLKWDLEKNIINLDL